MTPSLALRNRVPGEYGPLRVPLAPVKLAPAQVRRKQPRRRARRAYVNARAWYRARMMAHNRRWWTRSLKVAKLAAAPAALGGHSVEQNDAGDAAVAR